jgi:hypothetical protein
MQAKLNNLRSQWPDNYTSADKAAAVRNAIAGHFSDLQKEWDGLYNRQAHFELRNAIVEEVNKKKK